MNYVIYEDANADGGVAILIPADQSLTLDEIILKDIPPSTQYRIVTPDEAYAQRASGSPTFDSITPS